MSEFTDIVHHVANIGEHVIEFIDGVKAVKINGATVTAAELVDLLAKLSEAGARLGIIPTA